MRRAVAHEATAAAFDRRLQRRVERRHHEHRVAWRREQVEQVAERRDHRRREDKGVGRDVPAVLRAQPRTRRGPHGGRLDRVAEYWVRRTLRNRSLDVWADWQVHIRHPERQRVGRVRAKYQLCEIGFDRVAAVAVDDRVEIEVNTAAAAVDEVEEERRGRDDGDDAAQYRDLVLCAARAVPSELVRRRASFVGPSYKRPTPPAAY